MSYKPVKMTDQEAMLIKESEETIKDCKQKLYWLHQQYETYLLALTCLIQVGDRPDVPYLAKRERFIVEFKSLNMQIILAYNKIVEVHENMLNRE